MIYRDQTFSRSYYLAPPTTVCKLDRRHTRKLRKRDNLPTGWWGEGGGREADSYDRKKSPVLCKSFNTLCPRFTICVRKYKTCYAGLSLILEYLHIHRLNQRKDIDTEGYVKPTPSSLFGYSLLVSVADF